MRHTHTHGDALGRTEALTKKLRDKSSPIKNSWGHFALLDTHHSNTIPFDSKITFKYFDVKNM